MRNCKLNHDLTNKTFNNIQVLERDNSRKSETYFFVKCLKCGKIYSKSSSSIRKGKNYSCGCVGYLDSDLIGKKFGHSTVLDFVEVTSHNEKKWKCRCDCGNITYKTSNQLTKGHSTRCAKCGYKSTIIKNSKKPKYSKKLYECYVNMKTRVTNKKQDKNNRYINRNITMCKEWLDDYYAFEKWALENGYAENLTIDRIDNNGNYEPSNCRWVDRITQANNRRTNVRLEYNGKVKTMAEWSKELDIPYYIIQRDRDKYSLEEIVKNVFNSRHKRKNK